MGRGFVAGKLGRRLASSFRLLLAYSQMNRVLKRSEELERRYDLNQIQRFEAILNQNGYSLAQFSSMLEFGCGRGRLIRHLFGLVPEARLFGCDVRAEDIDGCRRKYPLGHFVRNQPRPPTIFEDNQFDFIFSFSVFTHLNENDHKEWLGELARILRPGGLMLHTTHSYECLFRLQRFSPEKLAKYQLPCSVERLAAMEENYHFVEDSVVYRPFGLSVISKKYVTNRWPRYAKATLVGYVEGAIESFPEGCHDVIVMRKNGR